jgi:hypothetical protein
LIIFYALFIPSVSADTTVGGTISTDTTWTMAGSPYIVTSNITVRGTDGDDQVTTLSIEPGVVVKLNSYTIIYIGASSGDPGALIAQGTADNPILFTSNQAAPAPGDWNYIRFYPTTDDTITVMENCVVEYGGYSYGPLYVDNASPAFRNINVRHSKKYGIYIRNSDSTVEDCIFSDNQNYDLFYTGTVGGSVIGSTINSGISLLATGTVNFSGNTINQNNDFPITTYADNVGGISASTFNNVDAASYMQVNGGTLTSDATWTDAIAYAITSNITVKGTDGDDQVTTLTIEPGGVVKLNSYAIIYVGASSGDHGALIAQGTADNPILFTSNQAAPAPGDWNYIRFYPTTDDTITVMENCVVEYGGYSYGILYLDNAAPRIINTMVRNSKKAGIHVAGNETSSATINCNTFSGNYNGIYVTANPPPEMHNNNFNSNTNYGIYYSGAGTLNAEDNWWGDAAGPNQTGDATYGNVDADPWSTAENQCVATGENQPPNEPDTPDPADGAIRVAVSNGVQVSWSGGDPDILDTVVYDFYLGTSADGLAAVAQDIGTTTYQFADAAEGQTYYWQIIAKDNRGAQTPGPVWMFTTDGELPDLIIGELTVDPLGNLQQGQTVTFTVQIENIGNGPVVDAFSVDVAIDGASIGTLPVDTIMLAGESTAVSIQWTYSGGDPTLRVTADDLFSVTETYENNNQYAALISEVADNTAPVLSSHSPLDNAQLQQLDQITFTLTDAKGTVDDTAVIAGFSLIDPNQQPISGTISESSDTFTFIPANLPLADGTFQVNVTSADTLGNQQVYPFSFVIDTQPPAKPGITGGAVASGTIQPRPATNQADDFMAPLEGTRDAGTSLWINGTRYLPAGVDTWSVDLTLQQGDNTLEIWCVDSAGNQSESEWVDIYVEPAGGLIFDYNDAGRMKRVRRIQ